MQRRKFLATVGSLAAGSAAAMGTGAVTSGTFNRPSNIATVSTDADGIISFKSGMGNDPDVQLNNGQLEIDLSGSGNQGVNINSVYKLGEDLDKVRPSNLSDHQYAFAIQNNDDVAHHVSFSYTLDDDSWVHYDGPKWRSDSYHGTLMSVQGFPHPPAGRFQKSAEPLLNVPAAFPDTEGQGNVGKGYFKPGFVVPFQIIVDTTGSDASVDDDLGGTLTFDITS